MATCEWIGNALAVAQEHTWTFAGTWEADDVINVTINGKTISVVAGSTTAADVATAVYTELAASTIPEFREIEWTDDEAGTITGTAVTAGLPFTCTFATTETGGGGADSQTINGSASSTGTVVFAASGPNDVANTANWSGAALPGNGDTIIIRRGVSLLYGLTALTSITPAVLKIFSEFWANGSQIGLAEIRGSGSSAYVEYRSTFLEMAGATAADIGLGTNTKGNSLLNIDFKTGTVALTVHRTPTSNDDARPALCLAINPGTVSNGNLEVLSGTVGVGFYNETCKVVAKIGYKTNVDSDSVVYFGPNVTHGATFTQSGGIVEINSATTQIDKTGGTLTINGTGAHPIVNNFEGALVYNSTGTLGATSVEVGSGAVLDFSQDLTAKTLGTTIQAYAGAEIRNPADVVTSFAFKAVGCRLSDITVESQIDKTWTPS